LRHSRKNAIQSGAESNVAETPVKALFSFCSFFEHPATQLGNKSKFVTAPRAKSCSQIEAPARKRHRAVKR
jgi:hypothetical protein